MLWFHLYQIYKFIVCIGLKVGLKLFKEQNDILEK